MKKDLSKISTESLIKELDSRTKKDGRSVEAARISSKFRELKLVGAVEYELDLSRGYGPNFILGVLKSDKFKDFYYNSGLEYEEFQKLIPAGFCESQESTYEFHDKKLKKQEEIVKSALLILSNCGYEYFKDITEYD